MDNKLADGLVAANLATSNGNKLIAEALDAVATVVSAKSVRDVQTNQKCKKKKTIKFIQKQNLNSIEFTALNFLNIMRTSLSSVANLYKDLVTTITVNGNNFLKNSETNQYGSTYISASHVFDLVITTNEDIALLFKEIGEAFSKAKVQVFAES